MFSVCPIMPTVILPSRHGCKLSRQSSNDKLANPKHLSVDDVRVPIIRPVHFSCVKEDGFRSMASNLFLGRALDDSGHKVPKGIAAVGALK